MFVAIDVGGTKIKVNTYDKLDPNALSHSKTLNTSGKFDEDVENIVGVLSGVKNIKALGVALPGFVVDKNKGIVSAANLPSWEMRNLKSKLSAELGVERCFLLHDGEAHAKSETVWHETENDFVFIAWGTGIGATYIRKVGNEVLAQQIEFGFQHVNGVYIESLVGGSSFEKRFGKKPDKFKEMEWDMVINDFSEGISNLIALNYPKQIVWGGGVVFKNQSLVSKIMQKSHEKYPFWEMPKFKLAHFESDGGVIGALAEIKLNFN